MIRKCKNCGKEFHVKYNTHIFCSVSCAPHDKDDVGNRIKGFYGSGEGYYLYNRSIIHRKKTYGRRIKKQLSLDFDGVTYNRSLDQKRLTGEWLIIFEIMRCGKWRTLYELSAMTGYPTQSISARLRDFRKARFGGHTVNRRRMGTETNGTYEYQLIERKLT